MKATVVKFDTMTEYEMLVLYKLELPYKDFTQVWIRTTSYVDGYDAVLFADDEDNDELLEIRKFPGESEHDIILQEMGYQIVVPQEVQEALIDEEVEASIRWLLGDDLDNPEQRAVMETMAVTDHDSDCFCSDVWDDPYEDWLEQGQHLVMLATFRSWDLFYSLRHNPLIDDECDSWAWDALESRLDTYDWHIASHEGDPTACYVAFISDESTPVEEDGE